MRHAHRIFALSLALVSPALQAQVADPKPTLQASDELNLSVGENTTIPAGDVKSFSEGIRGIADIKLTTDNSQFVIAGQKRGTTTLLLIKKDGGQVMYTINVSQRPMSIVERELSDLLQG